MKAQLLRLSALLMVVVSFCGLSIAADDVTARNPIRPPLFSIDLVSPEVLTGTVGASDLLLPGELDTPEIIVPAEGMMLVDAADDVDALSFGLWEGCTITEFVLLFSVDRISEGSVPPDETLVGLGFPFNVQDQSVKHQAAGDAYMSLLLFTRLGAIPPGRDSLSSNNTLTVNQGDAGGVDFSLSPQGVSPNTPVLSSEQSNVNAGSGAQPPSAPGVLRAERGERPGPPNQVLFSLISESPALQILPGTGSGADIYIDYQPLEHDGGLVLYAAPSELGLIHDDDIDAMIVVETDFANGFTPGVDQIIFSLAPGSPSLVGTLGPGDLFTSSGNGIFGVYCFADQLGLYSSDNLNMLDYLVCDDVLTCAQDWAIGYVNNPCIGDLDGDNDVDLADLALLLSSYGLCAGDAGYVPAADFDGDECIGLSDLATLLAHYGESCP